MENQDLLQRTIADRYVVEREIGSGGMATVYLARDIRHDRAVALKVLKPELAAVLGVERFLSEIKVTANLQHPNLLPLFDSGEADGRLFYVMPYVAGESLRARLDRERQLPVADAVRIASSVASALHYAHRNGVIHRDLKPENILMHEGQPLVADFGIALAVSKAGGTRITESGLSLGTPHYMSPEQATADHQIDGRTDVYSLGAVLYEMLTGEPPHTGKSAQAIIARVLTEKPRSVRATRPAVPIHVEETIDRALEKLPADRFGSAQEFSDALTAEYVDGTAGTRARRSASDSVGAGTLRSVRIRRAAPWVTAAIVAAVAGAEGGWLVTHRATPYRTVRFALDLGRDEGDLDPGGIVVAVSPDGDRFAYLARKAGGSRKVFVRGLADLTGKEVPGSDDAYNPFFLADGKWIGFRSGTELKKVPIAGGSPVTLGDIGTRFFGAVSMPNGDIIMSADTSLLVMPSSGGIARSVSKLDASRDEIAQRWPLALSDGEHVLFGSYPIAGTIRARIGVLSIKTGKTHLLDLVGTCPVAVIDGLLIYSSAAGALLAARFDERTLRVSGSPVPVVDQVGVGPATGPAKAAISRSGSLIYLSGNSPSTIVIADSLGNRRPLDPKTTYFGDPRFSPDGRRVALSTRLERLATGSIWIYTIASGTLQQLTTAGMVNDRPEWTPDGQRVVFRSDRSSPDGKMATGIWWQRADGSDAAQLLFRVPGANVDEAVISPDGRTLLARVSDRTVSSLWVRDVTGDTTPHVILPGTSGMAARISPDGRWVAYASRLSGPMQVYVSPLAGDPARYQVSADGGASPVWSPDGRRVMYAAGQQIIEATLRFKPSLEIASRRTLLDGSFDYTIGHAGFDISPNGKELLLSQSQSTNARLILVHDWRQELLALVRAAQR